MDQTIEAANNDMTTAGHLIWRTPAALKTAEFYERLVETAEELLHVRLSLTVTVAPRSLAHILLQKPGGSMKFGRDSEGGVWVVHSPFAFGRL